jgi:glucosamine--fructose-6-phosphate aminotransferase (isomerizing)
MPAEIDIASEFRYRNAPLDKKTLAIFVSQSGETADTLAALRHCKQAGLKTLAIVNAPESSMQREAYVTLPTFAGPEIGVASTKAFTCQLTVLLCLSLYLANARKTLTAGQESEIVRDILTLPRLAGTVFKLDAQIIELAGQVSKAENAIYIGRGAMFPLALEGALKLKEISYIHAEGFAAGELKHGSIALVEENLPVIALAPKDALYPKTLSNMQEVIARQGRVIMITDGRSDESADPKKDDSMPGVDRLVLPSCHPSVMPILYALPLQLLAYHTAVAKGTDVDQPRNLAKSVTVE